MAESSSSPGSGNNRDSTAVKKSSGSVIPFTIRGFSKCDATFVHYSLFESYSLSGLKI